LKKNSLFLLQQIKQQTQTAFISFIFRVIRHFLENHQILTKNAKNFDKSPKTGKNRIWISKNFVVYLYRNLGGMVITGLFRLFLCSKIKEKRLDLVKIPRRLVEKSQDFIFTRP
jgi:hypothetical protein